MGFYQRLSNIPILVIEPVIHLLSMVVLSNYLTPKLTNYLFGASAS